MTKNRIEVLKYAIKNTTSSAAAIVLQQELDSGYINQWLEIGKRNPWIKGAYDPPFNHRSFYKCQTKEELKEKLLSGNWSLGQAFYYNDICFINQVNGGDEWLVIKGGTDFESVTAIPVIKKGKFDSFLDRVEKATDKQLKLLEY